MGTQKRDHNFDNHQYRPESPSLERSAFRQGAFGMAELELSSSPGQMASQESNKMLGLASQAIFRFCKFHGGGAGGVLSIISQSSPETWRTLCACFQCFWAVSVVITAGLGGPFMFERNVRVASPRLRLMTPVAFERIGILR